MRIRNSRSTASSKAGRGAQRAPQGARGLGTLAGSLARPGFTLLELSIAMLIMSVVLVILMNAFMGSRKAQGQAVSMMGLKVAGATAIEKMYLELSQAKRLLASMDAAPAEEDIGRAYFTQMDLPVGLVKPIPLLNMRFPRIAPEGKFIAMGNTPGQLSPLHIGNSLVMVTRAPEIALATPGVQMKFGSLGALRALTPEKPFRFNRFRFVAYYLTEELLPSDAPNINGTMRHTMGLARWESRMYVDKGELEGLLAQVPLATDRTKIWNDLITTYQVAAAWDPTSSDPTTAFYAMDATTALVVKPGLIQRAGAKPIASTNLDPYARGMVAFNTNPNFQPTDSLKSGLALLQVPQFGEIGTQTPYGFEVGVVGSNAARSVLLRLSLAARVKSGNKIFGWSHQQIVQMMDN